MTLFKTLSHHVALLVCFSATVCNAQTAANATNKTDSLLLNFGKPGHFVIKGKVAHFKDKFFEFASTTYMDNVLNAVPVNNDGSFEKSFPVTNSQDLYLYLNDDAITFSVKENDTLYVNWDQKDFEHTFRVHSQDIVANKVLQVEMAVYKNDRKPLMDLMEDLGKKRESYADEQKYQKINEGYNHMLRTILSVSEEGSLPLKNLLASQYFNFCALLNDYHLLEKYQLKVNTDILPKKIIDTIKINGHPYAISKYSTLIDEKHYRSESLALMKDVPAYRSFMLNYIRFTNTINSTDFDLKDPNFSLKECYAAKANFSSPLMQDWYITQCIILGFEVYNFNQVEEVYQRFYPEMSVPFFKDALSNYYRSVLLLKPGNKAPAFTLKDEKGKKVSLADFQGKVVYIDFWGVYCGPCIYEIENHAAKLHDTFKNKDVVFLYVCVDVNEAEWKKALKKYQLPGVNVLAEGWTRNPVIKDYNVNGIPHYVLINKDGTIRNNNAARPSEMNRNVGNTEIDKAL